MNDEARGIPVLSVDVTTGPLSSLETRTLIAVFERMFPADELGPGATDIGAAEYVVRALGDAYRDLVPVYQAGLRGLEDVARRDFGRAFGDLEQVDQDAVIARLERHEIVELEGPITAGFFDLLWKHLREGLFCDPIHGGNRDMMGWRLIGFPGAQYGYTQEEQELDYPITREPRSVAELVRAAGDGDGDGLGEKAVELVPTDARHDEKKASS